MMVEVWDPEKHQLLYQRWADLRGMGQVDFELLSPIGFVVDGIAAGFGYVTTNTMLIDAVLSDPRSTRDERERAVKSVAELLIERARSIGMKRVLYFTTAPTLIELAGELGFVSTPGWIGTRKVD